MDQVVVAGLDLAKSVFQVHGVGAAGQIVVRRQLRRSQLLQFFAKLRACLIGMEAWASSHHWARELMALGHEVRLMPAQYLKRSPTSMGKASSNSWTECTRRESRFSARACPSGGNPRTASRRG